MILPLASGVFAPVAPGDRPAFWAVTGRLGGHSSGAFSSANIASHVGDDQDCVDQNLEDLAQLIGMSRSHLALMEPVHGKSIGVVAQAGVFTRVDALVSASQGVGLVAMGADCVPLLFYGSRGLSSPLVSAVHCGWKGLVAGIVTATILELRRQGASDIQAVVGPAICGGCYSSHAQRRELVRQSTVVEVSSAALQTPQGIDVRAGVIAELALQGIAPLVVGGCTYENPEELFSYRRERGTGRQGAIVAMTEHQEES